MRFWPCPIIRPQYQSSSQTTNVVGIVGYLAPELTRTRRETTCANVFAFQAFMLENALLSCSNLPWYCFFCYLVVERREKTNIFTIWSIIYMSLYNFFCLMRDWKNAYFVSMFFYSDQIKIRETKTLLINQSKYIINSWQH